MMPPGGSATPVLENMAFYVQIDLTEAKTGEFQKSLDCKGMQVNIWNRANKAGVFELISC